MNPRTPILVGAGELTVRPDDPGGFVHPLEMMTRCARAAADDAGSRELLSRVDAVHVVNVFGWSLRDAPGQLAARLGLHPTRTEYTVIGGNAPQWLANRVADRLAAGACDAALLAGVEVLHSVTRAARRGVDLGATRETLEVAVVGDDRPGSHPVEIAHHADLPVRVYPILENALRACEGISLDEQRRRLGQFGERSSAVAARTPGAWFPVARTAEELARVTPDNRMIAFPYTKYLNAIMNVDQACALLMTTVGTARRMGIAEKRWTWFHGGQDAHDLWYVSQRPELADSPAIAACVGDTLRQAGMGLADVTDFDLYSCFPCMPRLTRRVLGIDEDDPRPMTLTGGLPYFGGPGSNYSMHAITAAARRCRADREAVVLVTANGWYCTKHSAGVWSGRPPRGAWSRVAPREFQRALALPEPLAIDERPTGGFTVDGYTVWYERDGHPAQGILCGRTDEGRRAWGHADADPGLLAALTREEWIGRRGHVLRRAGEINVVGF